jgi:hypothetical protein
MASSDCGPRIIVYIRAVHIASLRPYSALQFYEALECPSFPRKCVFTLSSSLRKKASNLVENIFTKSAYELLE